MVDTVNFRVYFCWEKYAVGNWAPCIHHRETAPREILDHKGQKELEPRRVGVVDITDEVNEKGMRDTLHLISQRYPLPKHVQEL